MLKRLLLMINVILYPCILFSESRITIKNESYLDLLINMPDLTRFNSKYQDYPVQIFAFDKNGVGRTLNNTVMEILHHEDTIMIQIPNDFVEKYVAEKEAITFNPVLRRYTKISFMQILAVPNSSPMLKRKLVPGELLEVINQQYRIFLRAWYVIKTSGIVCQYFYDAVK